MKETDLIPFDGVNADVYGDDLQFSPIKVNEEYKKKWNETSNDFICLTRAGKLINNNLYRIGGLGNPSPGKDKYFMLIKYIEAHYADDITKDKNKKPHLEGRWVILNAAGIEKFEATTYRYPSLVKDSVIFSIDRKYYNIETKEFYCEGSQSMECDDFIFLENRFDDDRAKRGVMKVNKLDGTYELFKRSFL